jgi:D-alanyl-D-alanine carboxypeptidase
MRNRDKILFLQIISSAVLSVLFLFFLGAAQINLADIFTKVQSVNRITIQAQSEAVLQSSLGDLRQQEIQTVPRNFLPIADFAPLALSNLTVSSTPELSAQGAVVLDRGSGFVLFEKKQHKRWPMASITKLITASVLLDFKDKLSGEPLPVRIMSEDFHESRSFVNVDDVVAWDDLFNVMLVGSSNTATRALVRASGVGEQEFRKQINQKLLFWGMQKTQINEISGLSAGNISTAYEVAQIFSKVLERREIKDALSTPIFTFMPLNSKEKVRVDNTNWFILGNIKTPFVKKPIAKTGFIEESGFNIVGEVTGKGGEQLIITILGASSHFERFTEMIELGQWVFASYQLDKTTALGG